MHATMRSIDTAGILVVVNSAVIYILYNVLLWTTCPTIHTTATVPSDFILMLDHRRPWVMSLKLLVFIAGGSLMNSHIVRPTLSNKGLCFQFSVSHAALLPLPLFVVTHLYFNCCSSLNSSLIKFSASSK